MRSLRAAAALVAGEAAAGKLTGPYVRAQSEEYAQAADALARQAGSDPGDASRRAQAVAGARATAAAMRSLAAHPDDRAAAAVVEARLRGPAR